MKRKKIFIGFLTLLNIASLSLQLLAMGSLGLGFELPVFSLLVPLLLVLNLVFFIFWLVRFQWPLLLTVLAISIGYEELQLLYQIGDNGIRIENGISVISYNVRSFNRFKWIDSPNIPDEIENFINLKRRLFSHKRKSLKNLLKNYKIDNKFDLNMRVEDLDLINLIKIFRTINV